MEGFWGGKNNILIIFVNEVIDVKFFRKFFEIVLNRIGKHDSIIEVRKIQNNIISPDVNIELIYNSIVTKYKDLIDNEQSKINIVYLYNLDDKKKECSYDIKNCCKQIKCFERKKEVNNCYEIKIINSIEEWLLIDIIGICNYLNITPIIDLKSLNGNTGLQRISSLFKSNARTYEKGNETNLINCLNFNLIYEEIKDKFKDIIDVL